MHAGYLTSLLTLSWAKPIIAVHMLCKISVEEIHS